MIVAGEEHLQAGVLDVLTILHKSSENTYHPALFEERRLPVSRDIEEGEELPKVFLVLRYAHEEGFDSLDKAKEHITELRKKLQITEQNLFLDPRPWNGKAGKTITKTNWLLQTEE